MKWQDWERERPVRPEYAVQAFNNGPRHMAELWCEMCLTSDEPWGSWNFCYDFKHETGNRNETLWCVLIVREQGEAIVKVKAFLTGSDTWSAIITFKPSQGKSYGRSPRFIPDHVEAFAQEVVLGCEDALK